MWQLSNAPHTHTSASFSMRCKWHIIYTQTYVQLKKNYKLTFVDYSQRNIPHLKNKTKREKEVRRKKRHDTTPWSLSAVASNSNNWTVVDRQSRHVQLNAQQKCTCIHLWTKQNIPLRNVPSAPHRVIQKRALTVNKRSQAWESEVTTWRMFKPHFFLQEYGCKVSTFASHLLH